MPGQFSAEVEITVPFQHVDPFDVAWHGHYVEYFEQARAALLDQIGYNYLQMRESGYGWPVVELYIRYARPLHYGQRARVRADLVEWETRLKIEYAVLEAETGQRLTTGHSVQVPVQIPSGEMCFASPDALFQALGLPRQRRAGG